MTKKIFIGFVGFIVGSLFVTTQAIAQAVMVKNTPRPFTVVPPTSWVQLPTTTGNSRIRFATPLGTPEAECAVVVQEYPSLRDVPQSAFNQKMVGQPNPSELSSQLSSRFNNVKVFSTGLASISGIPAQLFNVQYSVGTPSGEHWSRGIAVITATTPGLSWTITCGAHGKNLDEAQKGFSYWQSEIMRFPTNIKIRK
jgi:hypothetical protein